jgi:hypothetical protein
VEPETGVEELMILELDQINADLGNGLPENARMGELLVRALEVVGLSTTLLKCW